MNIPFSGPWCSDILKMALVGLNLQHDQDRSAIGRQFISTPFVKNGFIAFAVLRSVSGGGNI